MVVLAPTPSLSGSDLSGRAWRGRDVDDDGAEGPSLEGGWWFEGTEADGIYALAFGPDPNADSCRSCSNGASGPDYDSRYHHQQLPWMEADVVVIWDVVCFCLWVPGDANIAGGRGGPGKEEDGGGETRAERAEVGAGLGRL